MHHGSCKKKKRMCSKSVANSSARITHVTKDEMHQDVPTLFLLSIGKCLARIADVTNDEMHQDDPPFSFYPLLTKSSAIIIAHVTKDEMHQAEHLFKAGHA
jgi:hypothetical protein